MFLNNKEVKNLKEYIYTPCGSLNRELEERQKNIELKKKIEKFWGDNPCDFLGNEKNAVLSRTIFTPNIEFEYFMDMVNDLNLKPLFLEYGGKFVAKNFEKYHLCKLFFIERVGKKGGVLFCPKKIVNFNEDEGKDFSVIQTVDGEDIVDFHHQLLEKKYPGMTQNIRYFSEWFDKTRFLTEDYYFYFLSLFIYHGVLFENFLMDDKEESIFIKKHLLSSFKKVHEYFGVKPLITPLLPIENEKSRIWASYRGDLRE